jgi:hypothetical protein
MNAQMKRRAILLTSLLALSVTPIFASAQSSGDTQSMTKAQRKEARKEARAKKNAELKALEKAGYNPAQRDDTKYPDDIQAAEKKVQAAKAQSATKAD